MSIEKNDNEISVNDLVTSIKAFIQFYKEKKLIIAGWLVLCISIGIAASFVIKPKYTASLSFAIEDSESGGGSISSLASQFGISLGAGSGGAFGGDNIYELFYSRYIIEKTLLSPLVVEGKQTNLVSLYADTYNLNEKFAESKVKSVREANFAPAHIATGKLSRSEDSIVGTIYATIAKKMLSAQKRSKKLNIGDISFVSNNELLSKLFVEQLILHTSQFYSETKTKVTRQNYELLKYQTDSVKQELDKALTARAYMADNSLNNIRQSSNVGLIRKQTDIQVSMNAYIEMKKNLEMLKYSLAKETPLIQIIDRPILPLEKTRFSKTKGIAIGAFCGIIFSLIQIVLIYLRRSKTTNSAI